MHTSTKFGQKVLASPNSILWQFYDSLVQHVKLIALNTNNDERRQNVAVCIILAITLVEAFINLFFRVIVSEPKYRCFSKTIVKDIERQASLDYKIKEWPRLIFGKSINFSHGVGKDFLALKNTRNWLMHFNSTHETLHIEGTAIEGLADITMYETLGIADSERALNTAVDIISEIIKLSGIQPIHIPSHLHLWIGKLPALL